MRHIHKFQTYKIPDIATCTIKDRVATVVGPRGTLVRDFRHLYIDIYMVEKDVVRAEKWFGRRKETAALNTVCTHIKNMVVGVTKGYLYKMRAVYAHFPINCAITENNTTIEIRNFLGEKVIRKLKMLEGVTVSNSPKTKDELYLEGNNIEAVSQSAASIQQSTKVRRKDIRKFLDGLYVSEKTTIIQDD